GALAAAVAAVHRLEDEPLLNAGLGACTNSEGDVELDAGVMEGMTLRAGGVAGLRDVRHPIDAAVAVMRDGRHVILAGPGASKFAREHGVEMADPALFLNAARHRPDGTSDTVGAVARYGAVCGTGQGEAFIRLGLARLIVVELQHGMDPAFVAKGAVAHLGTA